MEKYSSLGYDYFDRGSDIAYTCNNATVECSNFTSATVSSIDDLRNQVDLLTKCVNASAISADELGAGLKTVCNKMKMAGKIFKTHLKRSDLAVCFNWNNLKK